MDITPYVESLRHDLAAAARCDAAVLFAGGRLVRVGGPAAVIAEYEAALA